MPVKLAPTRSNGAVQKFLSNLTAPGVLQVVLRNSPAVLKCVCGLLLFINARSWPLVWHYKVFFLPVFEIRLRYYALLLRTLLQSKQRKLEAKDRFFQGLGPVGEHPFKFTVTLSAWAGPDDCDANWHLSNSSYPKTLDWARFRAALRLCPTFYRAGGWVPLGATHFKFIREIPMLVRYEMRISIAAWDNKWMFVVVRFVTPKKSKREARRVQENAIEKALPSGDSAPYPSLHTPAQPSDISTPDAASGTATPLSSGLNAAERVAQLVPTEEPDGATLHCISVSELCFKIGRLTVPPALVLASEGFCGVPLATSGAMPYSLANPPPSFVAAQVMQKKDSAKGHLKTLQTFYRGGWRDVPEGERWWEEALGGEIEERRKRNLDIISGVSTGMDGALRANTPL